MHAFAFAALLLACALSPLAQAQEPLRTPVAPEPGAPGTATPQPYGQPQIRNLPMAPRSSPPLLVNPGQPSRQPMNTQPLPKDQPLPLLETQRRSQDKHPTESIGKP